MKILLTNDDGIYCEALHHLYKELSEIGEVFVAAPLCAKSGASHSLSLTPVTCKRVTVEGHFTGWAVDGTPADCVKLAVLELYKTDFDLIVSGMNVGANVGVDMLYSGTVAAAVEGAFYGIPAVAISAKFGQSCQKQAAAEGVRVLRKFIADIEPGDIFNINVPLLENGKSKGIRLVRQAEAMYEEKYFRTSEKDGEITFQIGSENHECSEEGTDRHAIHNGYSTITPLSYYMTHHGTMKRLEKKFGEHKHTSTQMPTHTAD